MTATVLLLQGAMLLTLLVTPAWNPPRVTTLQLLWAWMHRPTFYPLVALLAAGPVLTVLAWRKRGPHRYYLALGWAVFLLIAAGVYRERMVTMLDVLWSRV